MNKKLPLCINPGCNRPVVLNGRKPRPHCGACQKARWQTGGARLLTKREKLDDPDRQEPQAFHKWKCSNKDGHLGFTCPTKGKLPAGIRLPTDLDHIDGDGWNNTEKNVEELCKTCHILKSKESGDVKGWRY